jgi:Flp pilus assembly protein TadD
MATHSYVEARDQFQEAVMINPGSAEAYNDLGIVSAQLGKTDEAIGYFRHALWLRPGYDAARKNLVLALEVQKKSR